MNTKLTVKRKINKKVILVLCAILGAVSCESAVKPSRRNPVSLTMWHTYVEQMRDSVDDLLYEFNETVGAKEGISVTITAIANANVINEKLLMAAAGELGAPEMPDMVVVYPKVAVTLAESGLIADLEDYFSPEELSHYVPEFLEEGRFSGGLFLLPAAKSTEVLYVNKTLFDRFAKVVSEGGGDGEVRIEQLATFEGIIAAAERYHEWSGGKTFYYPDGLFNFFMIGFEQMGDSFLNGNHLNLDSGAFETIWKTYYESAVKGGTAIFNDYGNYLAKTGDIICATSTSAGAMFYPDSITYPDNTKETVEFIVMPYPVFEGGEKTAVQRGGGVCIFKSDKAREYGAARFLKWFTEPEQNVRFTASAGYMPVEKEAYGKVMNREIDIISNRLVREMLVTVAGMRQEYRFYFPPVFDGFDELQNRYVQQLQRSALRSREIYTTEPAAGASNQLPEEALDKFRELLGE
jgi:multiple sugar transport system substrate-binding protein